MEGTCVSQENSEWGGTWSVFAGVLQQPSKHTHAHTHTLTAQDAEGRTRAAQATASVSYVLWISGDLLENCWLLSSSVHCGVGRGHVILDSKSKWDVLGFMVWEAVETFILFSFQHTHWTMWTTTEAIVSLSFLFLFENYIQNFVSCNIPKILG